ncbi:pimeloyl-ACP methyl ester carboxylesterase [Gracilibacillus alcaliphilus]|nr:pimeloyl-ACP methyl ester carboxylesterase [Gracilibacillus alcaliphilus]
MQFAIDYPDLVEGLILLNSVSHRGDPLQKKDASGRNTRDYYASKTEMSYDPEIAIPATAIRHHDFNTLHDMWHSGIYTNKKPADSMSQLLIKETMKQRNLEDMYWILAHFNISDQYNGYSQGNGKITQIQTHVLSYWGEQDQIVTLQDTKDTVEALPNARLRVLKNCGHSPLVDQLEEILAGMEEMF